MTDLKNLTHRAGIGFLGAAILFLMLRLIGSFFPVERLWGINHAAYINGLWLIYPALMVIAVWIYFNWGRIETWLTEKFDAGTGSGHKFSLPLIALALIMVIGFYLLSVKEFFLGDGHYLIASMASPDIGFKPRGYGEMLVHRWYMEWFWGINDYTAYLAYRHLSIGAGIIFLATIFYYGRKITSSRFAYYGFIALSLSAASTILFYGYVENYSLLTASLILFFLSGAAAIQNKTFSIVPIVAFAAAVFLHFMALAFLPSLILYIILSVRRKARDWAIGRHPVAVAAVLFGAMCILYAIVKLWGPPFWKIAFLSPLKDRFTIDNYTLLSSSHILDFLNLLVFLIPVGLILAAYWLFRRFKSRSSDNHTFSRRSMTFLFAGAITGLMAAFIIEPKLGMARDWDLMSAFLIGAVVSGIYGWVVFWDHMKSFRMASLLLFIIQLSVFVPWLVLNNSPRALYDYGISMMELDPKHSRASLFRMIAYNEGNNHPVEAARLTLYCRETFPEMWLNQDAMTLLTEGRLDEAKDLLDQALDHNPGFFSIYLNQAMYFWERNEPDSVAEYLSAANALNPYNTVIMAFRGLLKYRQGSPDPAKADWVSSITDDARDPLPFLYLGYQYLQEDNRDSALYYLGRYPGLSNIYPVYFILGTKHLMKADSATVFDGLDTELPASDSVLSMQLRQIVSDLRFAHKSGQ